MFVPNIKVIGIFFFFLMMLKHFFKVTMKAEWGQPLEFKVHS